MALARTKVASEQYGRGKATTTGAWPSRRLRLTIEPCLAEGFLYSTAIASLGLGSPQETFSITLIVRQFHKVNDKKVKSFLCNKEPQNYTSPYRRRHHGLPPYESQDSKELTQPNVKVSTTQQNIVIFLLKFRTIRRSKKTLSGARLLTSANVTHEIIGGGGGDAAQRGFLIGTDALKTK